MTPDEKDEVRHLLEAHERTVAVCREVAGTLRDLAWEIRRGGAPAPESLEQAAAEAERVLADLGRVEMAIGEMKAALW